MVEPGPYGTDWLAVGARQSQKEPAYDRVREEISRSWDAGDLGDSRATRDAILAVADAGEPPLRIFFGKPNEKPPKEHKMMKLYLGRDYTHEFGGVAAVAVTGYTLSLGAMVGFIALFGMAARNTILLISHYDHLVAVEGQPWGLAMAARGAAERLTPVLLTASLTALALLPVAIQLRQPGHEIEGPMAVVILGGLVSSTLVTLVLIPPLAARWLRPG